MNTYRKYCPNVFVAQCPDQHEKGEVIEVTTKHGKVNECIVHNLVKQSNGYFYYSITRADGFNTQEHARRKAEKLNSAANNAQKKSDERWEASNEGADFLRLGEPIKVGHHSEKRHRALIARNWARMDKAMELQSQAEAYTQRAEYWEEREGKIDLSMPESIEYFEFKLEQAKAHHQDLKAHPEKRRHSYSLTYAKKEVNVLTDKVKTAKILWG